MKKMSNQTRRRFLRDAGLAGLSIPFLPLHFNCGNPSTKVNTMSGKKEKLGIALVGLGGYATGQLGPALLQTEHCYLAGIVTGTPAKIPLWKEKYGIAEKNIYNYANFDSITKNTDIDIVYIVLPNHLHKEYTIRGFQAGKHMICEKPMATTAADAAAMLIASKKANKHFSIGYRLHYDPFNLELVKLVKEKAYGEIISIDTEFSITPRKGEWRLNKAIAGGGPLMDVGIYCLQAICYTTGMEPQAITARTFPVLDREKFIDIEETLEFEMEMPGGITGRCRTSYSNNASYLQVNCEKGWVRLEPAYFYGGIKLTSSDGRKFEQPPFSQQAKQLDAMALAIKNNQASITPGEMGLRDMKIIEAIYKAMNGGKRVVL